MNKIHQYAAISFVIIQIIDSFSVGIQTSKYPSIQIHGYGYFDLDTYFDIDTISIIQYLDKWIVGYLKSFNIWILGC